MMKKRKISMLLVLVVCVILALGLICGLRYTNAWFRYNFDVTFNCDEVHYAYLSVDGEEDVVKVSLPLPASTALAFRHSDVAATYYSKLNYEDFLEYYAKKGFIVEGTSIYTENNVFLITNVSEQMEGNWKYYFMDITLSE